MKKGTLIKLIILAAVFLFAGAVLLFMFVSDNDSESGKPASVPDSSSSQAQVSSAQKSEDTSEPESTAQSEADSTDDDTYCRHLLGRDHSCRVSQSIRWSRNRKTHSKRCTYSHTSYHCRNAAQSLERCIS